MAIGTPVVEFSVNRPKLVTAIMVALALFLATAAGLPTLWPETFSFLNPLEVDTDPENMLPEDEPVRLFHDAMKREMSLYDMVVVGVVNEKDPDGVFNPESLNRIYDLTEYAKTLTWEDEENPDRKVGVVEVDIIAPSTVDNVEQGEVGVVKFEWLMASPPDTREDAIAIREKARRIPFLNGTMLSDDGTALCLYLPLTSKDLSYRVYTALQKKIDEVGGEDQVYITGLPVAEDTFGVEMFKQMAISAPLAMLIIFLLMFLFFRKLVLIFSPMIVAVVAVLCTMGLLVATGNTVHIMSSMIPIFIMPIAVLDAVHILSEFFDRYQETKDKRKTMLRVMDTLFTPMLYTSLTTAAAFASLALTPIPPVQIFGLFIAFGVIVAWIFTVTFIPAYVMLIGEKSLKDFGVAHDTDENSTSAESVMSRGLTMVGQFTYRRAKLIMASVVILTIVAAYGMSRIRINDNPIKWFNRSHPIRVADSVLNKHFGGTYMAYLTLLPGDTEESLESYVWAFSERLRSGATQIGQDLPGAQEVFEAISQETARLASSVDSKEPLLDQLVIYAEANLEEAPDDMYEAWDEALVLLELEKQRDEVFKQPEVLRYIESLQQYLLESGIVGKSNSLSDVVKTVYRELISGKDEDFRIPDRSGGVAECLMQFQNSHRPQDLWHFVTPDYRKTVVWLQLKSGDNRDMSALVRLVDAYVSDHPPPLGIQHKWFGLTYINLVWQDKMVAGMLQAFLGSFLIVLLMMTLLYRSALWGLLSMIPLTVTIGLIYGAIGLIGKDFDMPVAVLSALSLGLSVDYAIHFLSRSRELHARHGSWRKAAGPVFGEPARAITRNVVVIGVGFLPLLAAPLVPYKTVGVFIAAILITAGAASLLILPSMIALLQRFLFPQTRVCCMTCNCVTCTVSAVTLVLLVAINVKQLFDVGWTLLTWLSLLAVVVLGGVCGLMARREKCRTQRSDEKGAK